MSPIILGLVYLVLNISILKHTIGDPSLAAKMQEKDSVQYVEIAREFASGDFSMSYVANRPQRQPLYPALLAMAVKIDGGSPLALGFVNVVVGLAMLGVVYGGIFAHFKSHLLSFLGGLAFVSNGFMIDKIARRLMSEPLHALLLSVLIVCFLGYCRTGRRSFLFGASTAAGLDYLARTNGLFIMAAMSVTLLGFDLWKLLFDQSSRRLGPLLRQIFTYAGAFLIFAMVTTPSWLPRYRQFGDPFHHGNIANYMWVDSYDTAHTGLPTGDYHWEDYARSHSSGDWVKRWAWGFNHVFVDVPKHAEHVRVLYFLTLGGIIVAFWERRSEWMLLTVFLLVQLLPMVWTSLANPGPRVVYGSMFPFELFLAALGARGLGSLLWWGWQRSPALRCRVPANEPANS